MQMIDSSPQIELVHLSRRFGTVKAVDDVSFQVERGQVFGYIGPNGAGKTTSMRILATLDVPTAGDAVVDGFSVTQDPERVRRRVGFMPDYFETQPSILVEEYLDFFARAYGLMGPERLRAVRHVMSFTKLDVLRDKSIDSLSKGMKQRLCLGRAMIHDPPVMIMDEPAAGLDPRARIQLREMIRQLAADGKSILISSHILTELAEMCDTVAIIERGRLLAVGSVDEIYRARQAHRTVQVTVLEDVDRVRQLLAEQEHLYDVRIDGLRVQFTHQRDQPFEAELLKQLITSGCRVVAFGSRTESLEDVFMQVTEGLVQ
jgi:ABC-2 type transport system ATP-binding protein